MWCVINAVPPVLVLVLQALNKILYESYKVLHASYKEVWLFLGRNIVFQLATERTIFFSSLFGSYILKKSAGNTLDTISYNYRYIKLVLIYK